MKYDVIIVGAGASGMMAAITAASHHKKVLLLERMDKLGKKILATGNGRCNLSNAYMDENCYRGQKPSFAYPMIEEFGLEDLIQFFESLGMLVTEQNGYYYPASLQAATVVDTLTQKLKHLHVDILTEFEVTKAEKRKSTFYVYGNDKCFQSSNLILATGGCAQPNLGSNGSGYKLAKDFHHKITDTFPSLVGLEAEGKYLKDTSGVRNVSNVSVYANNELIAKEHGEVQETRFRSGRIRRQGQNGDVRRRTAQTAKDADAEQPAHHSVFPATDAATTQTCGAKFAQLFRFGMVCFGEYVARRHRRGFGYSVPYSCKRRSRENQTNCERSRRLRVHLPANDGLSHRKCVSSQTEGNTHRGENTHRCLVTLIF